MSTAKGIFFNSAQNKSLLILTWFLFSCCSPSFSQSSKRDFIRLAGKISSESDSIAKIWSGFWSPDEPFMLMKHDSIVQVYNVMNPGGDYSLIPPVDLVPSLKGKAFKKLTYLPEYRDEKHLFPGLYKLGNIELYALEPKGKTDFNQIEFYLHESFHFYQRKFWAETPGDTVEIRMKVNVLDNIEQVDNPLFISLLDYERDLLSKSLEICSIRQLEETLRELVVIREMWNRDLPRRVSEVIGRYERREGSATYLGLLASASANNYPIDSVQSRLKKELQLPIKNFPAFPAKEQQIIRWPFYSIGGAYSLILDRLGKENWKEELARGATFPQIVKEVVFITKRQHKSIEKQIMEKIKEIQEY